MPTISLNINVTDDQANALQKWFPKWNASLAQPYSSFQEALIGILTANIRNFVRNYKQITTEDLKGCTEDQLDRIRDIINEV